MKSQNLLHVPFELRGDQGEVIRGDVRYCAAHQQSVVVIAHGFKAFKDWGPFPHISERFAKAGFVSVAFNFSHNGVGPNANRITEFEQFAANTVSKEVDDLGRILDGLLDRAVPVPIRIGSDDVSIGIVGHSRGASVAIVRARRDRRVKAVAAWSAVSTFDRWNRRQKEAWRARGYLSLTGSGLKPKFRMGVGFLKDLEQRGDDLDVVRAVSELHSPLLLIYGKLDLVTPVEEAQKLYSVSDRRQTELILMEKTGHVFGAGTNPYRRSSNLDYVIDLTAAWFHRYL